MDQQDRPPISPSASGADSKERNLVLLVLAITTLTYLGTVRFDFVYDDVLLILLNPFVKSWRYISQDFTSSLWKALYPTDPANYYRPVVALWVRTMYSVFGPRPFGWHLVALLLYVVTVWLVYIVAKKLSGQVSVAWLAALIFGLHPIHHEVVAWVTGASESLVTITLLGAFLAYTQSRSGPWVRWMVASCALYGVALLCKETAIVLPALVFAYEWLEIDPAAAPTEPNYARRFRRAISAATVYVPIAVVYLIVRNRILVGLGHPFVPVTVSEWLRTLPSILMAYTTHWLYPSHLSEFYDVPYRSGVDFIHVVLPAMILVAAGAAAWVFRKRLDRRLVGLAAAWVVIPLLPALDTFVLNPEELVHDRYFYIPSVGAALLTAWILVRAAKTRTGPFGLPWHVIGSGVALSVVLAALGVRETTFWAHEYTVFERGHQIAPSNSKAAINLGTDMLNLGNINGAEDLFEAGYRQHPDDAAFAIRLGWIQYAKKQYGRAEEYARQGIALDPYSPDAYFYLGQALLREGRVAEAQQSMGRATELNPYSAQFHTGYGITLQLTGDCASAARQFEAALKLSPGDMITQQIKTLHCRAAVSGPQPSGKNPGSL